MARKRKRLSPEAWAEEQRRAARTLRTLQERIDYHAERLRAQQGGGYRPQTLEERLAQHEAKPRDERSR